MLFPFRYIYNPKNADTNAGLTISRDGAAQIRSLYRPIFQLFFFFLFHSIVDITGTSFSQHIIKGNSIKKESISKDTAAVHSTILAQLREDE